MKFIGFKNLGGTYALAFQAEGKSDINNFFVQFSFKKPWIYPHREERFNNGSYMYGWIFFYFGNIISKEN